MAVAPGDAIRPRGPSPQSDREPFDLAEAELVLAELASAFLSHGAPPRLDPFSPALTDANKKEEAGPTREDKYRWSIDAARLFVTGEPLRSAYRVMTREGRVVWFHCEAKMVRREDGRPWFLHGVGFDITELKQAERTLQERTSALQNLSSRLLQLQDEERRRIARELHDSLGQYLAALKINLDLLGQSGNN